MLIQISEIAMTDAIMAGRESRVVKKVCRGAVYILRRAQVYSSARRHERCSLHVTFAVR